MGDLPGLEPDDRLTLARRLVTESVASSVVPGTPCSPRAVTTADLPPADDLFRTDLPARPAGRLDAARCSVQALARGDSGVATASPVQRWLLVEQPGPWGRDALSQSRFDQRVAPLLAERARRGGRAACSWSAGPVTGWPTPGAGGPTPTAAPAARGCGGRCGRRTPTC